LRWRSSTAAMLRRAQGEELGVGVIPKRDRALVIFVVLIAILLILIFTGLLDHWLGDWIWQDDPTRKNPVRGPPR
jgi:hypothetical protein